MAPELCRALLQLHQTALSRRLRDAALRLGRNSMTREQAISAGRAALQDVHSNAAFAGRALAGASDPLGTLDRAYGALVAQIEEQFFDNFLSDVSNGRYTRTDDEGNTSLDEDAIDRRAARYQERARGTANEAWANTLPLDTQFNWVLGDSEHGSCSVCPDLAENSPYLAHELPTLPGNNETPCHDYCKCSLETVDGSTGF